MYQSIYIIALILGASYLFLIEITDIEFIANHAMFGFPYGLASFGLVGLIGENLVSSIIFGLVIHILISYAYSNLIDDEDQRMRMIYREARVTVPIAIEKKMGEVVLELDGSLRHFQAMPFTKITKPITKNSMVYIIEFNDFVALVSTEIELPSSRPKEDKIRNLINFITPRSKVTGVCMICFANLNASRKGFTCPHCSAVAHTYHIMEWVKYKGFCPNCREGLKINNNYIVAGPKPNSPDTSKVSKIKS